MTKLWHIPSMLISILITKGPFHLLHFVSSYIYLTIHQLLWRKRFDLYDYSATENPEKTGFFIPKQEWYLDTPKKYVNLQKFSDDAFIFGANSKSEYLAVHVSRISEHEVKCSLILRSLDGKLYILPKEHIIQRATSETNTFGSSRLKLQCLLPMRQWRVFFNGVLEEHSNAERSGPKVYKHFKLTFLWKPVSGIFDFSTDMCNSTLSYSVASSNSWVKFPFLLKKIKSIFDCYEQCGMLQGTIQIEKNPVSEMYLWGARGRYMGKITDLNDSQYTEVYGSFKNGAFVHIGILNIPGLLKKFIYGYVMKCNGFIHPIEDVDYEAGSLSHESFIIACNAGGQDYKFKIVCTEDKAMKFQKRFDGPSSVKTIRLIMNERSEGGGKGFIFKGIVLHSESFQRNIPMPSSKPITQSIPKAPLLTVPFKNERCQISELCGGKGSSLGKLFALSNQHNATQPQFVVPDGIVVTTKAYQEFIKGNLWKPLRNFEAEVWSKQEGDIKPLCEKMVKLVSESLLPDAIKMAIASDLKVKFGDSLSEHTFAVRSSATGEDTEQMSAAGQMETFLGLKGFDKIFTAVVKCWASQFTFQAIQYKRQYGQRLNSPMAVVIQEMIPCDVAGVLFTCDPVTGNPSFINITANWGLGESVVSASAEPDTITLGRNVNNQLQYLSETIGKKETKIVMNGPLGTKEIKIAAEEASRCCINKSEALQLGQIALKVEEEYGSPRDIEWGIKDNKIYLFQSRPVTSLDVETDFETMHVCDSSMQCEMEVISRAHVGEVMPGACSILCSDLMFKQMKQAESNQVIRFDGGDVPPTPYVYKGFAIAYYQLFFNLISSLFKFSGEDKDFANAFLIAFFGRLIEDKEISRLAEERHPEPKKMKITDIIIPIYMFFTKFFAGLSLQWSIRRMKDFKYHITNTDSSMEIIQNIGRNFGYPIKSMGCHMTCSFGSTFWNSSLLSLLARAAGGWNNVVYSDFAYLLSTCKEVESANVPASIEDLAYTISKNIKPAIFKMMDIEEALKWLQNNQSEAGKKFKQFLERHGHRCVKEFDVYSKVWSQKPQPLVKILQEIANDDMQKPSSKKVDSFPVVLSKLKVKLNFIEKIKLFWELPNARRAVGERERSKAFLVGLTNKSRIAFHRLAKQMVLEGRIPREEYLFFLSIEEIKQLCKLRSPRLVTKAGRRFKCFSEMDKLMFPEIIHGVPKPENYDEPIPTGKGFMMTGVPVSQGIIKARARVVKNISEASTIQAGEILITYSTDTAWSPYFPLLGGVVTELGGLISHGAVVAREYGLPCVVNLHGATRAFKSGELVILDGNKGTIQKVDED